MMLLKDKIAKTKLREKAGSTSASRFDYQKDWSICKLLEYHQTQTDYVIIFDWHEDLVIMDSELNPQKISFYQIKGKKSGNWTFAQLIKSEKDTDGKFLLSIIGKLYDCKTKFNLETSSLNFVSNARFNVELEDKSSSSSKDNICIVELSTKQKEELRKKIKEEHSLTSDPIFEDITFLKVLDLSLDDSQAHVKGKISDFLDILLPGKKIHVSSIYRMLFDEVKRRASYNKEILTYEELLSNKAIGKSQFESIIDATCIKKNYDEIWSRLENVLQNGGMMFQEIRKLKQAWNKLELARMNPNNDYLNELFTEIQSITLELESKGIFNTMSLNEMLECVFNAFKKTRSIPLSYSDIFIKAIILSTIYD